MVCAFLILTASVAALGQEPLRVRRNFFGMHNLKDGGPEYMTGFHWTKNLVGSGYVFDWVHNFAPNDPENWVADAIQMGLIPCVRVQEGAGGDLPDPGYAGGVAAQICAWKLAHPEYADRLVYLQLWNEPGDPRDYVPMDVFADYMVAAHAAVHVAEAAAAAQNPAIGGTLKTMTPGQNNPDSWTAAFSHNPAAVWAFDVWGSHPYPESYPPWYNMHEGHGFVTKHKMIDGHMRDLDVCAQFGRRGIKVMITETAYGDHLGISYEGYPKTTRQMASDYNVEAFGTWWYQWPEIVAVHPYLLSNVSWTAFEWCYGSSADADGDGVYEPTNPYPQYTNVRALRESLDAQGQLAAARLSPYRGPVGTIQGMITRRDTGAPVKYANVYTDGYEFGGPSLFDGQYVVYDLPVGSYTLSVAKRGYLPASQQITVNEGETTVANFSLIYEGKVPKGVYFVDNSAGSGPCDGCDLYDQFLGQTFVTPDDVGFIKFVAAKPHVGDLHLKFTIIEGDDPNGTVVGQVVSYYLEPAFGGEMIGGEAQGDGIPVQPNTTYFLKIERTDGQGLYCYASSSNPYPYGHAWVGNAPQPGWDLYGTIRGNTVAAEPPPAETSAGFYQGGWNLTSVPVAPTNPEASAVFDDLISIGNVLTNRLYRYDPGVGYAVYPLTFSNVDRGRGYWLWVDVAYADTVVSVAGAIATDDVLLPMAQGWSLIGHPFPQSVAVSSCRVTDGATTLTFSDSVAAGWVAGVLYYWESGAGYQTVRTDPFGDGASLRPWYGYWVHALAPGLQLIVAVP